MKFHVWLRDYYGDDDEGRLIEAADAQEAAKKFAERYDADGADYSIVSGETATVRVTALATPHVQRWFKVNGESVPRYYATETGAQA